MTRSSPIRLALAALILHVALTMPNHPDALKSVVLLSFPLELPLILFILGVLPRKGRATTPIRTILLVWLVLGVAIKLADLGTFAALNRRFNPVVDFTLLDAGWRLATGAIGPLLTALAVLAAVFGLCIAAILLNWAMRQWADLRLPRGWRFGAIVAAMIACAAVALDTFHGLAPQTFPLDPPGNTKTARLWIDRGNLMRTTVADLERFRAASATDPFAGRTDVLDIADGSDILLIFIESYGRTSFDNPVYAPTHTGTLRAAEIRLREAGLAMRSGWLTSPISGGQSWLAHGTVASGLKIDSQSRYHAMLASSRRTLFHIAAGAGFRTAAVMPAITLAWPEGEVSGFDRILAARDLGYRGDPFNWVTMPDQFTLTALDRLLRNHADPAPLFAQVALISSHAPWVPVPTLIDWDRIHDGTEFNEQARSGDPPKVVWRDRDRVRDQYRLAVDYSLATVMDYASRQSEGSTLMIVLGDHPPAGFVSQIDGSDVPVHVIGPSDLVSRFDPWGWEDGLIPDADTPVWPMEAFRDRFLDTLTTHPVVRADR